MEYIKIFEDFEKTVEDFFKNIISWKLINFIEYKMTKYEDMDDNVFMYIFVKSGVSNIWRKVPNEKGTYNNYTKVCSRENPNGVDVSNLDEMKNRFYRNGLKYGFGILMPEDDNDTNKNIMYSIIKEVSEKFNIVDVNIETDMGFVEFRYSE